VTIKKVDGGWRVDAQPGGRSSKRVRKTLNTHADAKANEAWLTTQIIEVAEWQSVERDCAGHATYRAPAQGSRGKS
jgi:hypothetical protein